MPEANHASGSDLSDHACNQEPVANPSFRFFLLVQNGHHSERIIVLWVISPSILVSCSVKVRVVVSNITHLDSFDCLFLILTR